MDSDAAPQDIVNDINKQEYPLTASFEITYSSDKYTYKAHGSYLIGIKKFKLQNYFEQCNNVGTQNHKIGLRKNAIAFLQRRFPAAPVSNNENKFSDGEGNVFYVWPMIAEDMDSGIKQRAIAVEDLGSRGEIPSIAQSMEKMFKELDASWSCKMSKNAINLKSHDIDTNQMIFAPRVILYTNKLCAPIEYVLQIFNSMNTIIDIVDESEIHKTLFISYGGSDEEIAAHINRKIKSQGVKTWFFPDDAVPGEKLHRVMHNGVNTHDRVLLICSQHSLTRSGVLNEIERVLEREAKEGGADILIPITLDDFVYGDWAPERADIADQVRSRVITKITSDDEEQFERQISKIVSALRK
jgi:hypothetical protein